VTRSGFILCLVGCGETPWDRDDRLHGATDLPLSNSGRASVQVDVERAIVRRIGSVYHPADEAATETARLFATRARARTKAVEELADPNLGLLEGLTHAVFEERFPKRAKQWKEDVLSLAPPEGEAIAQARSRILQRLARLIRRARGEEMAVVLHSFGLVFARSWLANQSPSTVWPFLEHRPRIERYLIAPTLMEELETSIA
jgi:probable phosphoglycerate mutase